MMQFARDVRDGFAAYSDALTLISRLRLWGYLILPGIISFMFGALVIYLAIGLGGSTSAWIEAKYPWQWGADVVAKTSLVLAVLIIAIPSLMIYKYVVLVLLAPFMSPLSEKIERHMLGEPISAPFRIGRFFGEIVRGIRVSLRNVLREILYTVLLLLLGLVPLVGLLSAPAIFAVQAYFAGFGNMDYTMERHLGVRDSASFVRDYKGLALANGTVFLMVLGIPVAGLFLAPALATIAGTLETVPRLEQQQLFK